MEELKANIKEVAQVLLGISCPVGLFSQIGKTIQGCAERLNFLADSIKAEEPEKTEAEPEKQEGAEE